MAQWANFEIVLGAYLSLFLQSNGLHKTISMSALTHAHGSAADVPACLRAALSDNKVHRVVAYDLLLQSIEHQGSVFQATPYAIPFLIKMLVHEQTPNKDYVVVALWQIARDCEGVLPERVRTKL